MLYVLSDLHLTPESPLGSFHQGEALAEFLASLPRQACLVLAGDTLDLLLVEGRPERLDWVGAPRLLREALNQLEAPDWGRRLMGELAAFVNQGGQCVLLPGNHDFELFHPACEAVLRKGLHLPDNSNITVRRESEPLRLEVAGREIVIGHGHRGDAWNNLDPATVHASLASGAADQALPPGSMLVLRTLNAFKRAMDPLSGQPRFPFVDKLKPEMPGVALLLLYLDPVLACQHLPGVLEPAARVLIRALRTRLLGGATLGGSGTAGSEGVAEDMASAITDSLDAGERAAPEATLRSFELALQGKQNGSSPDTLAAHGGRLRSVLRAAVRRLSYDHSFFDPRATGPIDKSIIHTLLPEQAQGRVVIAGHTHAAREVALPGDRMYINTGTWTDLLTFPDDTSESSLRRWIDDLEAGRLSVTRRLNYAVVDHAGPRLLEWPAR